MGAGQSSSQYHPPSRALHVLRVTPASPASKTSIEPFFDFVVGFEGDTLSDENTIDVSQLEKIVEQHEGRNLNLLVWSSKSQGTRVVPIRPSRAWSQNAETLTSSPGGSSSQPSLLGLSMCMCEPATATENVWHVLDVIEGSPAESAGLVPMGDWILGWSGGVLGAENDFYDLVESHIDKPLRVYVYSYDFDALREVVLIPNRHWGGEGLLGCVFGFGLLHRIPPQPEDHITGSAPVGSQGDADEYEEQELFVPADVHSGFQFSQEQLEEYRRQEQEHWNEETTTSRSLYNHHEEDAQMSSTTQHDTSQDYHHDSDHPDHKDDGNRDHTLNGNIHSDHHHAVNPLSTSSIDNSRTPTRSLTHPSINGLHLVQGLNRQLSVASNRPLTGRDEHGFDGEVSVAGTNTTSRGSLTGID